jgi:hypothetical protein
MKTLAFFLLLALCVSGVCMAADVPAVSNRLDEALASVGFTRADLGCSPKGYWTRFPLDAPHKLPFFDGLYAEPLHIPEFARDMADAAKDQLSTKKLSEVQPGWPSSAACSLWKLALNLGVYKKITGFRGWGPNLDPQLPADKPLFWAAKQAYEAAGQKIRIVTFGAKADWPDPEREITNQTTNLPPEVERIVAALLANVVDAWKWRQLALRRVAPADVQAVFGMRGFHGHSTDGQDYPYQVDDVVRQLDEESLYYAGLKAVQAAQDAARELKAYVTTNNTSGLTNLLVEFTTPIGRVAVGGTGPNVYSSGDYAVLVDLGGDDVYKGSVGASSSLDVPISIAIDLAGNDRYQCTDSGTPSQGAGVFGAGVLLDLAGDDVYEARLGAQGYGLFGLGMLVDLEGNDTYKSDYSAQGAAYFGIGLACDGTGNDTYYILGDGQGSGGVGGVGVLANVSGNDTYTAEPLASKAGRPDYHSKMNIAVSQAQGCGSGCRADGSHGHAWAGGLGVLLDIEGDDKYEAGNFSIGCGYWFGTGIVYDGGGNDSYRSVCYSQASGCHFAIGAIIDESGDDRHVLYETSDAGIASARDYMVALLLDGAGNDYYEAKSRSLAFAEVRSTALLVDLGGNDSYVSSTGETAVATALFEADYAAPTYRTTPSCRYGNSFALLLDIGGKDTYLKKDFETGKTEPSPEAADNKTWFKPPKGSPQYGYRSFGVGMDVPDGSAPQFSR